MSGIKVNRSLTIPEDELDVSFSTAGGPGGQHSNKVATRVTLRWNVEGSRVLGPRQRARILSKLGPRIDGEGRLRVVSDQHRSQWRNRKDAEDRLGDLVRKALQQTRRRIATQPSQAAKERRLEEKRRRSEVKDARKKPEL